MIFRIFKRIVSVIISAVLVLPLFACSAERPVMELFEAYVSEKDSVIREKPKKETAKEEAPGIRRVPESTLAAAAPVMPEEEPASPEPERKKEARAMVETVRGEVVSEVEKAPEEEAPLPAEEAAEEAAPEKPAAELSALSEGTEVALEMPGGPEAAAVYEENSPAPSLGGAAVSLASGSGTGHFLKLDDEGTFLTLTVHETVYDVRIGGCEWGFHQYGDTFQSDVLEAGTVITLQAVISSDAPDISISWTSAEGSGYIKYISCSAKDNIPMLVAVE